MEDGERSFTQGNLYDEDPTAIGYDPDVRFVLTDDQKVPHWLTDDTMAEYFEYVSGEKMKYPLHPDGYECSCGNYVSYEESNFGEAIICNRCDNGGPMEPV